MKSTIISIHSIILYILYCINFSCCDILGENVDDLIMELSEEYFERSKNDVDSSLENHLNNLSVYDDNGKEVEFQLDHPLSLNTIDPDNGDQFRGEIVGILKTYLTKMISRNKSPGIFFVMYTNNSSRDGQILPGNKIEDWKTIYNNSQETVIIVHGFMNSHKSDFSQIMKEAFLKNGNYNVILVDWSDFSVTLCYTCAAILTERVGSILAFVIDELVKLGADPDKMRLVGHSLGAQIVGIAGYKTQKKVLYVTGCDPARPRFLNVLAEKRLSHMSGQNVEVIHSNACTFGFRDPIGHADFYPNRGFLQPACGQLMPAPACDHSQSYLYLAESFTNPGKFLANKCALATNCDLERPSNCISCISSLKFTSQNCISEIGIMGTIRDKLPYRGVYYLTTNDQYPFSLGKKGLLFSN